MTVLPRDLLPVVAVCLALPSTFAASAPPSVVIEVFHAEERSGTVTLEIDGAPPCVIVLKGDGKNPEACTFTLSATAKEIRLTGEVKWKHWQKGRQVSKGTQSWRILDIGPMVAPLREASRPFGARMNALLAARPAFEKGSGGLIEESPYLIDAGEKGTAMAVGAAEKRLGYTLPSEYASLVVDTGVVRLGDSTFERPEKLANAFEQMATQWETPRASLEKAVSPGTKALYRSGTILFTEVGDGLGGLLYRPGPVAECGGKAAFYGMHQDGIDAPEILRARDGSCRTFLQAMLWVLSEQLFQQYDDTGDVGIVVDKSSPVPFRLTLHHDGDMPGPGFRLHPDWPRYE
ncbi:MAG TPA: hypothetical protein VE129_12170 [Thermoanaerobaculia bacterium]|nr:hypothetical protein [Thermoanaerobaculia bacterium]